MALRHKNPDERYVRYSAAIALGGRSNLPESTINILISALRDEDTYVKISAARALGAQSTLSESAIKALIGTLKDEHVGVRSSVAEALPQEARLTRLESVILAHVNALHYEEHEHARFSGAKALRAYTRLPEYAIWNLLDALYDKEEFPNEINSAAAKALSGQDEMPVFAIKFLICHGLQGKDVGVRKSVIEILDRHRRSICMAIPKLTAVEIRYLYMEYLLRYGHTSLYALGDRLCFYTERGLGKVDAIDPEKMNDIISVFEDKLE
ncbi:hypothetical protein BGX26_008435 [Mortierella sp. AD094]|nr:hypothetical protein BGX26_008435 [Mortierella sp. AD094]